MRYISLFSGIEAASVAWGDLGWEPVAFCEIDKYASMVLENRFPDVPNLGDITKVDWKDVIDKHGAVDLVVGGSPCFASGTLVLCSTGFKCIEDVEKGDLVLTHNGNWKRVLKTGSKQAPTITVKGQGSCGTECTENHPFFVDTKNKIWDNTAREHRMVPELSPKWVPAKDCVGKFWCTPTQEVEHLPIPKFKEKMAGACGGGYLDGFEFNNYFWYFVGRWLGDGWANYHQRKGRKDSKMKRVYICCAKDESLALKKTLDLTGLHFSMSHESTTDRFVCSSTQLYDWMVENFGVHADGKNIPGWLLGADMEIRKSVLRGYIDADGCVVPGGFSSTSINKRLCIGMMMLANSVGYSTCIVRTENDRKACIDGRRINKKPSYRVQYQTNTRTAYSDSKRWFQKVKKIEKASPMTTVYNLEVEGDNSYTADGIAVHNCQSFSIAGSRESLDGASGLMWEYCRAVRDIRPKWILWENVPGCLNTRDNAFLQLLDTLQQFGYGSLAWRTLNAEFFGVAQRRRRVFLVGHLGNGGGAAAVLFERESVSGNTQSSKQKRKALTEGTERGTGRSYTLKLRHTGSDTAGGGVGPQIQDDLSSTLATFQDQTLFYIPDSTYSFSAGNSAKAYSIGYDKDVSPTLRSGNSGTNMVPTIHTLTFDESQITSKQNGNNPKLDDASHTLSSTNASRAHVICMSGTATNACVDEEMGGALVARQYKDPPLVFIRSDDETRCKETHSEGV